MEINFYKSSNTGKTLESMRRGKCIEKSYIKEAGKEKGCKVCQEYEVYLYVDKGRSNWTGGKVKAKKNFHIKLVTSVKKLH